ncbi:sugar kinase [Aquibium carbonis]|uniref:Sugar kinase n=1 Tax=Aquibium carbonis TaxID=2495581 RepID=A0A3R9YKS1_9HYPH|nr:PfkB family carbohydrate kinase [Aquibium carbonis]RST81547.1 sugar kinase [Aquibium carbonis]
MTTILTVGVAVIDIVMSVEALPRMPEKYRARDAAIVGGGCAANAAAAVARLGGQSLLAARIGPDQIGDMIVAGLADEGVDCTLVRRVAGGRSSFSSIYVDAAGERQIVNFRDVALSFDATWLAEALPDGVDAVLADSRWPQGAAVAMKAARDRAIPGILDAEAPVREAGEALRHASHVAFSAQGLRDLTGLNDLDAALDLARQETGAWVCVTDGPAGINFFENGRRAHEPAFEVDVIDTLGAGDVWHGAFALALGEGQGARAAIRFASAVAALKCTRFGGRTGTPTRAEAEAFLRSKT